MNDLTLLRREHSEATQKIAPFTGEGAYHGSTRRRAPSRAATPPAPVDEMVPATLRDYPLDGSRPIADFEATFSNVYSVERTLEIPSQEEVRGDGVVFCWCPLEDAIAEAGSGFSSRVTPFGSTVRSIGSRQNGSSRARSDAREEDLAMNRQCAPLARAGHARTLTKARRS